MNPALEHFAAKNTAASCCSRAPRLAVGHYCGSGVRLAVWVGIAGLCRAQCVEELHVMWQDGVGGVPGVSGSSHPPPSLGCAAAAHTWKEQAGEKLGMVAPPACQ